MTHPPPEKPGLTREDVDRLISYLRHIAKYPDEWSEGNIRGKCREAADALALLSPLTGRGAWQPIETAPKDSRVSLLLWFPSDICAPGMTFIGTWRYPNDDQLPNEPMWVDPEDGERLGTPTHWQPLPAPPSSSTGGDAEDRLAKSSPGKDGWIEWNGGECPVSAVTRVDVKTRNGSVIRAYSTNLRWSNHPLNGSLDIVAYRLLPPSEGAPT